MELLISVLKRHVGEENAVTANQLRALGFGNARSIRFLVHRARRAGEPICSGNSGYYYPKNEQEKKQCKARLTHMFVGIINAMEGLKYTDVQQQRLF